MLHGVDQLYVIPRRIQLPEAYVVSRASVADGGRWMGELLRACLRALSNPDSIDVVDEEQVSDAGDLAGAVFKITEQLTPTALQQLAREIHANCSNGVTARLVKGVAAEEIAIDPENCSVEYFRREFATNNRMVHHTDSCAKVTHLPTGISARSTAHRSRAINCEEALLLLESLVRGRCREA